MRIATGGILHETSTCVDTRTTTNDFEFDRGIIRGEDMLSRFRGTNVCTGGFIDGADAHGYELVPLLRAAAFPGGLIVREDYDAIKTDLLQRLADAEAADGPVDGVLLDLHGAMVVEGIDDSDGDLVAAVRKQIGPDRPIVVTYDLHGNHTQLRVASADATVGFDTFPHVDMAERGREAADLIVRTIQGDIRPTSVIEQLPMFWSTSRQITAIPPMDEAFRLVHEIEQRAGILSITLSTGFPWADVPDVGSSVIVVTDNDEELATRTAKELAEWVWEHRQRWYAPPLSVSEGLAAGEEIGKYPIILADHADNTGGGSPGDSTEVLRTFLDRGLEDALLLYMVDPEVAQQAHAAGEGQTIEINLGGRSAPIQGPPIETTAKVVGLSDGPFSYDGPMFAGLTGSMGTSARLQIDGVTVVVVSAREQPFDPAFARSLGIDCTQMKYIALKSAAHFRAAFGPLAGSIHNIDASAIHSHDFKTLNYTKRTCDVFPVEIPPGT